MDGHKLQLAKPNLHKQMRRIPKPRNQPARRHTPLGLSGSKPGGYSNPIHKPDNHPKPTVNKPTNNNSNPITKPNRHLKSNTHCKPNPNNPNTNSNPYTDHGINHISTTNIITYPTLRITNTPKPTNRLHLHNNPHNHSSHHRNITNHFSFKTQEITPNLKPLLMATQKLSDSQS
jgi:hypothetical protein